MKKGKQRHAKIHAPRKKGAAKSGPTAKRVAPAAYGMIPVNEALLAPNNSYGAPDFVRRGYYVDISFRCADCGIEEVWTARSRSGGTRSRKASSIQRRSGAGVAGGRNESGAPTRGGLT